MHQRPPRLVVLITAASGLMVAGLVSLPMASASPPRPGNGVSFASTPVTSAILAHHTVTPAIRAHIPRGHATVSGTDDDNLPDLSPKENPADTAGVRAAARSTVVAPLASSHRDEPQPTASFIGQQGSNVTCSYFPQGCNPPDMAVAASPSSVLQGVNTQWEVLSPSGRVAPGWPVSAQQFFGVPDEFNADGSACDPGSGNQPFLSDPRAFFDPADHRFWAAMLQVEGGLGIAPNCPPLTAYWIAVSQTSDPRGNWNVYEFEMAHGTPFAADFTQIGLNHDALFFSANMFGLKGGFYAEVFEANKADMERGRANFTADGFSNLQATGPGTAIAGLGPFLADTVQPVLDLSARSGRGSSNSDRGASEADGLFVDTVDGPDLMTGNLCSNPATDACKGVLLWRMSDPVAHDNGGRAPRLSGSYLPNTAPFAFPPAADQPGCNACVDGDDLRIPATPMYRDGTIYSGWGTALDNGTTTVPATEWAQVDVHGDRGASVRTGYFALPGDQAATYPAFMPDGRGDVVMVYEHMSSTTNPEVKFAVHRSGAPFTDAGRVLKAGEAPYRPGVCGTTAMPVCRWGDYEAASSDGQGRIWLAAEYANSNTDPNTAPFFGRNWGTWMAALH